MAELDAFEMAKSNKENMVLDWARSMKIVSYGVVRKVLDDTNVRCAYTVQQSDLTEQQVDVSLLNISSSLFNMSIKPLEGDQVLILGLDAWSDKVVTGGVEQVKGGTQGYNGQSCVGILMRTVKMGSAFCASFSGDNETPTLDLTLGGQTSFMQSDDMSVAFTSPDGAEHPLNVDVMENRPYKLRMMSKSDKTYGADVLLTIGKDAAGETIAASVSIELDEQSDITLTSKSGASVSFDKDFEMTVKGKTTLNIKGDVELKTDGNATIKAKGDVTVDAGGQATIKSAAGLTLASGDASPWQPNAVPQCPFGMPHGGASCGIVKLKGQ